MTDISTPEYNTYFQGMDYMTEIVTFEIKHIFRDWGVTEIITPKSNKFSVSLTMTEVFCPPNPTHSQSVVYDRATHLHIEQSVTDSGGMSALTDSPPYRTKRHRDRG